ncbi:head-tail joining protein [Sphingobium sp. Z007]|uniref:head-tail joining protein n=1 Tax=Sphingobium sp. Z007 TaxID=627495 RepID=UPI000B49837D|nr:hypothetical protein [Sphingobium sp. Z007]
MSDPFASALDAIFMAPGSEAAEHTSIYGVHTTGVRIIRGRADQPLRMGDAQIITGSQVVEIRKAQVAELLDGDTLIVGTVDDAGDFVPVEELRLTGEAMIDNEGLSATIGAEPVDPSR